MMRHFEQYGRENRRHVYQMIRWWHHWCRASHDWTGTPCGDECPFCGAREDETRRPQ